MTNTNGQSSQDDYDEIIDAEFVKQDDTVEISHDDTPQNPTMKPMYYPLYVAINYVHGISKLVYDTVTESFRYFNNPFETVTAETMDDYDTNDILIINEINRSVISAITSVYENWMYAIRNRVISEYRKVLYLNRNDKTVFDGYLGYFDEYDGTYDVDYSFKMSVAITNSYNSYYKVASENVKILGEEYYKPICSLLSSLETSILYDDKERIEEIYPELYKYVESVIIFMDKYESLRNDLEFEEIYPDKILERIRKIASTRKPQPEEEHIHNVSVNGNEHSGEVAHDEPSIKDGNKNKHKKSNKHKRGRGKYKKNGKRYGDGRNKQNLKK